MGTHTNRKRIAAVFVPVCLLTFAVCSVHLVLFTNREITFRSSFDIIPAIESDERSKQSTLVSTDTRTLGLVYKGETVIELSGNLSLDVIDDLYYRFFSHLHYDCQDYIRLGLSGDGGWDVCLVEPYRFAKPCLVYSFGINNDFSFDDAVSIKYGCTVRAFDPSMVVSDHRRGPNIWFYKTGISGIDNKTSPKKWKLKTFQTIVDELGDSNKIIDYLKLDAEDAEWETLEGMFKTDILQSRVKQFGLEIHYTSPTRTTAEFYRRWKIMKQLEKIGFRRWYWHFNHYGTYMHHGHPRSCCYEMIYINTAFLNRTSTTNLAK